MVMQDTTRMIDEAVGRLQLRSGDAYTTVLPGWPVQVISAPWKRAQDGQVTRRNEQRIFFTGNTLVMRRADGGVESAPGLGVPGGNFTVTVLGQSFENGRVMVPGVRREAGGLLAWRYTFTASTSGLGFATAFDAAVDLLEYALDAWPASTFPTLQVTHHDTTGARAVTGTTGELFQLCAHYDTRGRVTVYQETPRPRGAGTTLFASITG